MDYLETIISTLDEVERREFRHFIQRNKRKNGRKDLAVFDRYCLSDRPLKSAEIERLGFPSSNAYHSTRKRLYAHLSDFAVLKSQSEDGTEASRVSGLIHIARHLFDRGLDGLAWTLIDKAEVLAEKKGLYAELNSLYLLQAQYGAKEQEFDMAEVIRRQADNRRRVEAEEVLLLKKAQIEHRIATARRLGTEVDLVAIFQGITRGASDRSEIINSPRSLYLILSTMRQSMIHSKEYAVFVTMAASLYRGLGNRTQHLFNAEILYMMAHAEYRNKQFQRAAGLLEEMEVEMEACSKTDQRRLSPKMRILKAANGLLLGQLTEALITLEELIQDAGDSRSKANVTLNLATYHFYADDFESALRALSSLSHTDKWYAQRMGMEWCFKHRLIELLTIHELGEVDLFESRMRSIQRRFGTLLSRPEYHKARTFLSLVKRYDRQWNSLDMKALEAEIELSWEWLPKEQEDLQAMMFYSWLKSKVVQKSCYPVLLDLMA